MKSAVTDLILAINNQLEPLKNLDQPFYLEAEFIGAMIASVTALGIAIFNEPFLNKFVRKSNLLVKDVTSHVQGDGELIVFRLLITNEGAYRARDVEVNVDQVFDGSTIRRNFLPVPLGWTHAHAAGISLTRDIHPNQSVYLDVCNYIKRDKDSVLRLSLKAGSEIKDFSLLKAGSTKLVLKAYQDSGQTVEINLLVTWDGINKPSAVVNSKRRRFSLV